MSYLYSKNPSERGRKDERSNGNGSLMRILPVVYVCYNNAIVGNGTDTIGAITGPMAGVYYGYDAIPHEWIEKLQRSDYILNLCDQFASTKIDISLAYPNT